MKSAVIVFPGLNREIGKEKAICEKLIANTVIENYDIELA